LFAAAPCSTVRKSGRVADVGIRSDRIVFVGDARA
jgi:hypothetical protein